MLHWLESQRWRRVGGKRLCNSGGRHAPEKCASAAMEGKSILFMSIPKKGRSVSSSVQENRSKVTLAHEKQCVWLFPWRKKAATNMVNNFINNSEGVSSVSEFSLTFFVRSSWRWEGNRRGRPWGCFCKSFFLMFVCSCFWCAIYSKCQQISIILKILWVCSSVVSMTTVRDFLVVLLLFPFHKHLSWGKS